jgi:hypothetical protein
MVEIEGRDVIVAKVHETASDHADHPTDGIAP